MEKSHFIGVRFDDDLFNMLNKHDGRNSDIIRDSVKQYLSDHVKRNVKQNDEQDDVDDEISMLYNEIYNQEIYPISLENKYLKRAIHILEGDKQYFRDRLDAFMVAKTPLLTRLKLKLISP